MRKICALLLAAVLLPAPAAQAKTVVMRVGWEKAQAMLAQDDFLSSIRVEMQSGKRLKGKLIGTTDEALRIERKKAETVVAREDIRAVRLVPRKAPRTKNRTLAIAGGAAAASEGDLRPLRPTASSTAVPANAITDYAVFFGTWAAIQFAVYRLGLRADRGAVLLELTGTAADALPPTPLTAAQPAPTR